MAELEWGRGAPDALAAAAFFVVMAVAPAGLAMTFAVDSVAVLVSIGPTILRPMTPKTAACEAGKSHQRGQYSGPIKCIHLLTPSEYGACSYGTRKFG
jgi:hypothetical protein